MEDMTSLWSYEEGIDELKQKLLYATIELEAAKVEASEEMRKNEECVKQSLQLLKAACQERDEARDQLQKLLTKFMPSTGTPSGFITGLPQFQPRTRLLKPTKPDSAKTESDSLSDRCNYHSHGSSPADSFYDPVSSPELPSINVDDSSNMAFVNQPFVQDFNASSSTSVVSAGVPKIDQASIVIENLVKGKPLPQKGKLLQAVMEAGPLLQTLLVAGPLPRWRNPPPLQAFQIPPVAIKGCDATAFVPRPLNSAPYVEMSCGSSQMLSLPMLNFAGRPSASCLANGGLISAGATNSSYIPIGKRQRLQ